ncbi:DUF3040 domain-containing protein [Actinomyces radicidentis]|uniref:DUF3040 domain-containing protein n=1 Tax=Actinomyces radicidentis TaxID=111015 RepID=A0A0X8JFM2_ACTRD|nr:DUF3040 domain-containing protein [Actinomyces radicidentis]AMD87692.1 hypothetical protein AXF14_08990 [Actinomyces radicidentis]
MALSEREQQVLRDLEEQLHDEDPALVDSMDDAGRELGRLSPRHVGGGIALILLGLAVLVGGVAVGHGIVSILLGVAGFGLAVWGVTMMLTRAQAPEPEAPRRQQGSRSSFMDRQSERWEQRRDQQR